MKKLFVLMVALLLTTTSFAQGIINLFNKSQDFFTLMNESKFADAHAFFDETAKTKITEDALKQLWGNINSKLGAFESADVVQSKTVGEYYQVFIEGKFANDSQNFLLVYNKAEKVVGLFLPPKASNASYQKPAYADTTLYTEKEVYIETPGHKLVGSLTVPKKGTNFPIVVLVHGSGPSDMDETIGANKPFKDLAAGLAANGVATIRYVKRTMLYANEFSGAFTVKEEVADDALAAVALARITPGVDKKRIFVLGHSLGGMIAPKIATLAPDLNGIILAATPARKLPDVIADQYNYLVAAAKDTTEATKTSLAEALADLEKVKFEKLGTNVKPDSVIVGLPASYWADLNATNQVAAAQKLSKQRVMVMHGGMDYQVTEKDYAIWNTALGKKKNVTMKLYPELNHVFTPQTEKGTGAQYQVPGNIPLPVIADIATWIKQ